VGLKFGEASQGAQVASEPTAPGGLWIKDSASILKLEPFADELPKDQGDRIKALARHFREGQRLKKEREAREAEAKKAAEAERLKREAAIREREENDLRSLLRLSNPGISAEEVESLLPEMRQPRRSVLTELSDAELLARLPTSNKRETARIIRELARRLTPH
jgi:hypothetical protein